MYIDRVQNSSRRTTNCFLCKLNLFSVSFTSQSNDVFERIRERERNITIDIDVFGR